MSNLRTDQYPCSWQAASARLRRTGKAREQVALPGRATVLCQVSDDLIIVRHYTTSIAAFFSNGWIAMLDYPSASSRTRLRAMRPTWPAPYRVPCPIVLGRDYGPRLSWLVWPPYSPLIDGDRIDPIPERVLRALQY